MTEHTGTLMCNNMALRKSEVRDCHLSSVTTCMTLSRLLILPEPQFPHPWNEVKVAQSCLTLCDTMDYIVHGNLQARILECVAFPFSRGSSQARDWTQVSCIAGRFFTSWATREAHGMKLLLLLLSHISRVQLCATPGTAAYQAPPSMGFSRQEYRTGLPWPSPMEWRWQY